ncbi:hypothetical protein KW794_00780 [Candidatus Saccharibacteria bacterium]|nr:hypothetical protein [Candidatus Saccharibacteria bacterium]
MLLVLHIIVALLGISLTTYAFFSPSAYKIKVSYLMVLLTIASGTVMVIKEHLNILSLCLSGLLYVGFTVSGLIAASHRLAKQTQKID